MKHAGRVAVVGYCWGGTLAYVAACELQVSCAVSYYGGQIREHLGKSPRRPVMYHFGEKDPYISAADIEKIRAADPNGVFHIYPADHGFNCDERGSYDADSARARARAHARVPGRANGEEMIKLADASLLKQQCLIAGTWQNADSGATAEVTNPATGEKLGTVPNMGAAEARRAIEAAHAAMPAWARKTAGERARILRKWFELMMANQDDLAIIMTAEQGKPLAESKGEIAYAAAFIEWFAEEGKRIYGDIIPGHQPDKRIMVLRQPIGVVAAITPWNFPAAMITRKAGPALAAGCTIVCKPATQTPYSALAMAKLALDAGIPAGVFSVVTGEARRRSAASSPAMRWCASSRSPARRPWANYS